MGKNVLAVQFSQTGQLSSVLASVLAPLQAAAGIHVQLETLRSAPAHPFPWPFWQFLDSFPETVHLDPPPLAPMTLRGDEDFDLIILAYPVWFLSPAPAMTAFLQSDIGRALLRGKPVVTVTACRNMWLMAQETVKQLLAQAGARHCDHIALVDAGNTFATFITTPRWMFTGRKNSFWGLPAAGVDAGEIRACARFGHALVDALGRDAEQSGQPMLQGLGACRVDARLIASEKVGLRSFRLWGKLLRALGKPGTPLRRIGLFFYMLFLIALILTVLPISMLLKALLRPLLKNKLAAMQRAFEAPSGAGEERLAQFLRSGSN